ncbi:MAG: hypothetical protein RIB98_15320 [Acidimicrobiales bacterium]
MTVKDSLEAQFHEVEESYRKLVAEIEKQLTDAEKRAGKALDDLQKQSPDEVAQVIARLRDMNLAMRKHLASASEQALDATREAVDSLTERAGRLTGRPAPKKPSKATPAKVATATKPAGEKAPAKKTAAGQGRRASAKWTKAELSAEATRLKISGRSSMTKAELVRAINKAI